MRGFLIAALGLFVAGQASAETLLERGDYLANTIVACGNCHTPQTPNGPAPGLELAGGNKLVDDPRMTTYAPNITPSSRVGTWSDAELKRAIREGVRPDGSVIGPPMPFELYRHMSDADLDAIVAYVRTVPPSDHAVPKSVYRIPLPPAWGPPVEIVAAPDKADTVAYGAYLAGPLGHCVECHSSPDERGVPDIKNALGAGGMTFTGPWGESVSANIMPSNLADWTDAEIERAVRTGVAKDGRRLMPPMAFGYYAGISAEDMAAIIAYLRTLPPM